jgi:hypothetical protein
VAKPPNELSTEYFMALQMFPPSHAKFSLSQLISCWKLILWMYPLVMNEAPSTAPELLIAQQHPQRPFGRENMSEKRPDMS